MNLETKVEELMENHPILGSTEDEDEPTRTYEEIAAEEQHNDLVDVLAEAHPTEALYVQRRLRAGKIDGSTFGDGRECACLIGTIGIARGVKKVDDGFGFASVINHPAISRLVQRDEDGFVSERPAEDLFRGVGVGDKPGALWCDAATAIDQHLTELFLSNPRVYGPRSAHGLKEGR